MKMIRIPHSNANLEFPETAFEQPEFTFDARTDFPDGLEFLSSMIRTAEDRGYRMESITACGSEDDKGIVYPAVFVKMLKIN